MSPKAAAPIIGAVVLVIGTASAVFIDARRRRCHLILEQQHVDIDAGTTSEIFDQSINVEEGIHSSPQNKSLSSHTPSPEEETANESDVPKDPPLLLPTVSAATSTFGSLTYNMFVVTALIHAACLIMTGTYQRQVAATSDYADPSRDETISILVLIASGIAAGAIILTSVIPAKGKGTVPHIVFGFIFIETAILWMTWTVMITHYSKAMFGFRIGILSLSCVAMMYAIHKTRQTIKLRGKKGIEDEWWKLVHNTAICQLSFGLFYSIFLGTVAADFISQ